MSEDDVPEWAIDVALDRIGVNPDQKPLREWRDRTYANAALELARMIASHEPEPVDPLREAIVEAYKASDLRVPPVPPSTHFIDTMTAELRARGATLSATQPLPATR